VGCVVYFDSDFDVVFFVDAGAVFDGGGVGGCGARVVHFDVADAFREGV